MSAPRNPGPKVKELAAELEVKPRAVQAAAAELGIAVQNRLTRITLADAARIRAHLSRPHPVDPAAENEDDESDVR